MLAIEVEVASTANNLLLYFSSGYILRPLHTHEYLGSLQMTHLADSWLEIVIYNWLASLFITFCDMWS